VFNNLHSKSVKTVGENQCDTCLKQKSKLDRISLTEEELDYLHLARGP